MGMTWQPFATEASTISVCLPLGQVLRIAADRLGECGLKTFMRPLSGAMGCANVDPRSFTGP